MTFPDRLPAWMTEKVPPMPAWCRGAGEPEFTSYIPATGSSSRCLQSPPVHLTDEVSVHLFQEEEALFGRVTRSPVCVRLWGHDGDLPTDLTAEQAQALGVALVEHAARLRDLQQGQA